MSRNLNGDDLEKVVDKFLALLFRDQPDLIPQNQNRMEEIKYNMVRMLQNVSQDGFKPELLADKGFLKELTVAFVAVLTLDKMSLNKENSLDEKLKIFLKKIGLDTKDLDLNDPASVAKFKNELKLKMEKMSPTDKAELKQLLQPTFAAIAKDLEKAKLLRPEPGKKPEDEMTKAMDSMENLFGIVCSAITGSLASVIPVCFGNAQGIVDYNPNQGTAQIDRINDPNDSQQGDSLGLNAATKANYAKIEGDAFVEEFVDQLVDAGLAPRNSPGLRPHMPGTI